MRAEAGLSIALAMELAACGKSDSTCDAIDKAMAGTPDEQEHTLDAISNNKLVPRSVRPQAEPTARSRR